MSRSQERHDVFDGDAVKRGRAAAGLTNEQLAAKVKVSLRTVQRWQDGENEPRGGQLIRLALALGVRPGDLYVDQAPAA